MKPFNLYEAKQGKPVYTRSGWPVRVICFDAHCDGQPIVALVKNSCTEYIYQYTAEGLLTNGDENTSPLDLMMDTETHVGWVNVKRTHDSTAQPYSECGRIYDTEDEALMEADKNTIATVKITYEAWKQ